MWTKIISSVSFLMQAVLVVAAVLLFSFFDPFNIFGSKKKTLKDTPISVSSIREIGELITAEYYGEVLGSLKEINIEKLDSNIDLLADLDTSFANAMSDMRTRNLEFKGLFRKRKIENYFDENYSYLRNDPYFSYLMDYLQEELHLGNERQVFKYFYDNDNYKSGDISKEVLAKLPKKTKKVFIADRELLKKQIVMLGRGSVKAGYKFDNFNENNFKYSAANNIIYFIGLKPEILACHINPWFIPEKKVKGYELVLCTGKASDPKYIAEVKDKCVEQLRESAMKQDILGKAQINARENLKSFFSLLLDKPVNDVVFLNSKLEVYLYDLKLDNKITNSELSVLDSIAAEFKNDSSWTPEQIAFRDSVFIIPFEFNGKKDSLNLFSSLANKITADGEVDSTEYKYLKTVRDSIDKPFIKYQKFFFSDTTTAKLNEEKRRALKLSVNTIVANTEKLTIPGAKNKRTYWTKLNPTDTIKIRVELDSLIAK